MIPRKILFWSIIFAGGTVVIKLLQSALMLGFAAILPPVSYANFGILYSLQSAMGVFSSTGLSEYAIGQYSKLQTRQERNIFFSKISKAFVITFIVSFLLIFSASFYTILEKNIALSGALAMTLGGIIAFGALQAALQRLNGLPKHSLYSSFFIPFLSILGSGLGALIKRDLFVIFAFSLLAAVVAFFILALKNVFYINISIKDAEIKKLIYAILPYIIIGFLGWVNGYGINFFIDVNLGSLDVAYFTFLFSLASIAQLIASSMNMSWSPHFYKTFQTNVKSAETQARKFYMLQAFAIGIVGFFCVALLPYIANYIGGNLVHYADFKVELALLFFGYLCCVPFWHAQNYFFVNGMGKQLMHQSFWSGMIGLILWITAMMYFGPIGTYLGFSIQATVKSVFGYVDARRKWEIRPPFFIILISTIIIFLGILMPSGVQL